MTILPNKLNKNKPGQPKDDRVPNERKRPRSSLYPTSGSSQKVNPKAGKNKLKQRRETPRQETGRDGNRTEGRVTEPFAQDFQVAFTPPISPSPSARLPSQTLSNDVDGYNSEDEYEKKVIYSEEKEKEFRRLLQDKRGFEINEVVPDGACLFRSVSDQIYGDEGMHDVVRKRCCDYMELNQDYFQHFITEDFKDYIIRKREPHTHGNHVEIQAMSEQYCRQFEIYEYSHTPRKTFDCTDGTPNEAPIRLSYHNGNHYNSVRDPYRATIGIGLGIAGLNAGSAEDNLMNQALEESLNETERRMLLDKAKLTDYQATDQALLAQVARDSLQDFYHKKKTPNLQSLNRLRNSPSTSPRPGTSRSPVPASPRQPSNSSILSPGSECSLGINRLKIPTATKVSTNQPGPSNRNDAIVNENDWALSDWITEKDEDSVLQAILQQSAQEFFQHPRQDG